MVAATFPDGYGGKGSPYKGLSHQRPFLTRNFVTERFHSQIELDWHVLNFNFGMVHPSKVVLVRILHRSIKYLPMVCHILGPRNSNRDRRPMETGLNCSIAGVTRESIQITNPQWPHLQGTKLGWVPNSRSITWATQREVLAEGGRQERGPQLRGSSRAAPDCSHRACGRPWGVGWGESPIPGYMRASGVRGLLMYVSIPLWS